MNKAAFALQQLRGVRGSIVALLVIVVALPLISLWATFQVRQLSDRIITVDNARLGLSRALRYALDEETGVRGYVETHKAAFLEPYHAAHPRMNALLAALPGEFRRAGLYDVLPQLNDFARLHNRWHTKVASKLLADRLPANALKIEETGNDIFDMMRIDSESVHTMAAAYTNAASRRMFEVMVISGLLAVAWIGIVGTFTILFERRAMRREMELVVSLVEEREAVERLSDWRSRLLAMLAHDFKSQLAVIIGAAHLLEDFPHRRGDPELLASVRSSGYTLAEMADNAILLARAQERRLMLQRSAFDITEIVDTVVQRYGAQREFHVYNDVPTAFIDADRSYITRVMDNIIGNAVKYSERPVDVHIGQEHDKICIRIADHGAGISDEDLPHIFEEFWRAENMQWSKRGSGVGLFIVKQIMEAHNGSIRVDSVVGKGTTVSLRFQRAVTAFTAPAPPRAVKTGT
ncbi:MAG TPA: ATP-binding protein [Candidatus Baltobacteraceae bacterium]|nr:ATP-binding protein [Candidatus Baltobacteraceae bacterium]